MISDEQKHPFGDKKESVGESSSERKFNFLQLLLPNAVFSLRRFTQKKSWLQTLESKVSSKIPSMQLIR